MPSVAIVGRPNVGKSAIFNRLVGRPIAIVHDEPGVTRDRITAPCALTDNPCDVIDTGGIGMQLDDGFIEQVTTEAEIAIVSADMILFVVDAREGITVVDSAVAQKLRRVSKKVRLVINKADHHKHDNISGDFSKLGFGPGQTCSAEHGRGFPELLDTIDDFIAPLIEEDKERAKEADEKHQREGLKISIVGKPNAGKSSLVNAILNDERTIVSEVAGTTRDAVDIPYFFAEELHTLIDTAGLRQRQKMDSSVEIFSAMRSERAVRRSDICLLVIDLEAGISSMDRKIAKSIKEEHKPCLIVLNKWDLFFPKEDRRKRMEKAKKLIDDELFFLSFAPFACVSAKGGQHISQVFSQITKIRRAAQNPVSTGLLNRLLAQAMQAKPPSQHKVYRKRVKLLYAAAVTNDKYTAIPVPEYILFVNNKRFMHEHYEQYLANRLREKNPTLGVPIVFSIRSRNRTKGGKGGKGGIPTSTEIPDFDED